MYCIMRERIMFMTMGVGSSIVTMLTVRSIVESKYEQLCSELRVEMSEGENKMRDFVSDNNKKIRDDIIMGRLK